MKKNQKYEPQSKPSTQGSVASRSELTSQHSSAPWQIILYSKILILCLLESTTFAQTPPVVMQWGTHLDIKKNNGSTSDWCYAIKETRDGGFIACGYSGHASGYTVGPAIVKLDPTGNVMWHHEYDPTGNVAFGALTDIIETENGNFAAVGEQQGSSNYPNNAIFILTDPLGNELNASNWVLPPRYSGTPHKEKASNIVQAPDGDFFITVNSVDPSNSLDQGFILKTDGYTINSTSWTASTFFGTTKYNLAPLKLGVVSGLDCDIIVSGWHQLGSDVTISENNCDGNLVPSLSVINSDVDAFRIHYTNSSNTYSTSWSQTYPNSIFAANHYYDDLGPYYSNNSCSCSSPFLDFYFSNINHNEPSQLIVSKNQNEIEISCYVGLVWPQDLPVMNSNGGVYDCNRTYIHQPSSNAYGEYKDANAYVLKINYSNGGVVPLSSNLNPIHVAHFSADDFRIGMTEDDCENIYIAGTTSDWILDYVHSTDLTQPAIEDALVCKIANDHTRLWRRNFVSPGLIPTTDPVSLVTYDENCIFNIAFKKEDNTVLVVGNNGENEDDMFITKLSGSEQLAYQWDYSNYNVPTGGITYWPGNGNATPLSIRERILIPNNATLVIDNCTIEFGETRELFDFSDLPYSQAQSNVNSHQGGIVIQKGGKLIVRNHAELRGLEKNSLDACSRDYMWDGISIEGDPAASSGSSQGQIEITDNATIRDARCGMRFDSRTWFNNQQNESTNSNDFEWDKGRLSYPSS